MSLYGRPDGLRPKIKTTFIEHHTTNKLCKKYYLPICNEAMSYGSYNQQYVIE